MRNIMMVLALILASSSAFAGSFNGSGTFVRSYNWTQDAANGIPISAPRFDTEDNGFATGLSTCVTKDGQTTPTSNLPMGGFRHTGVGQATARTHYAAASQVQDNTFGFCSEVGSTSNTYVVGSSPVAFPAYTTGMLVWFRAQSTNTTSATLNVNALGAIEIKKNGLTSVAAGDIVSGTYYGMLYDGVTNSFMPLTTLGTVSSTATVQSVGLSAPAVFNVSNTPVTTSGTISLSFVVQPSNTFLAGPVSGSISATPAFRLISSSDLPSATTLNRGAVTLSIGEIVQTAVSQTINIVTVTTAVPLDNTPPQTGETTQLVSVTVTPKFATSILRIRAMGSGYGVGSGMQIFPTIFRDSNTSAIITAMGSTAQANATFTISVGGDVLAGSISPTTLIFRAAVNGSTAYFNSGAGGSPQFNGTAASYIEVNEIRQ